MGLTNAFYALFAWVSQFGRYIKTKFCQSKALPKPAIVKVVLMASAHSSLAEKKTNNDEESQFLDILSWDLMIETNGKAHNTLLYSIMHEKGSDSRLVVRRGQEFFIKLNLDRDYDPKVDAISLILTLEGIEKPHYGHGTIIIIPVLNVGEDNDGHWSATLSSKQSNSIILKIVSPTDSLIGKWKVDFEITRKDLVSAISYTTQQPIYMLFNPWCPEDTVYIADEEKRQHYVVQDAGHIFKGTHRNMTPSIWEYSQYKRGMLDCALYLMNEVGKVRTSSRNDPIMVSRVLSGTINSNGRDNKVMVSNWMDVFTGGISQTNWIGSYTILRKFYKSKQPVKYGQCWELSGVYTTVCRALGLPCRVVTNYVSARDAEGSVIVDCIVDSEGKAVESISGDTIWTFHTWNEVWMKRLDLGAEYDGWQAIDTSPAKTSDNSSRCGPSSVVAIKKGEVRRAYNSEFLFGEVNADILIWKHNGDAEPMTLIRKDTTSVGRRIVTEAIGMNEQEEDLTFTYKYPEESPEERQAALKALNKNVRIFSRLSTNEDFKDIKFDIKFKDGVMVGHPFDVQLVMENLNSEVEYQVLLILRVDSIIYTGKKYQLVKSVAAQCSIKPGSVEEVNLPVSWEEYGPKLQSQCMFRVACLAKVYGVNHEYFTQDVFQLLKPRITTEITKVFPDKNQVYKTSSFINPLPVPLHDGEFIIDSYSSSNELRRSIRKPIMPGEEVSCHHWDRKYGTAGVGKRSVKFRSKELDDIEGYHLSSIYNKYARH